MTVDENTRQAYDKPWVVGAFALVCVWLVYEKLTADSHTLQCSPQKQQEKNPRLFRVFKWNTLKGVIENHDFSLQH